MLPPEVLSDIDAVMADAEHALQERIADGSVEHEDDMTSSLLQAITIFGRDVDGVQTRLTVINGTGRNAPENVTGADFIGAIRIRLGDIDISKGFLAQSKRSGHDGLHFRNPTFHLNDYSHRFARGPQTTLHGPCSGTVSVTKPSPLLEKQCDDMLRITPASFVFVFDPDQIAVVSAAAVHAHENAPRNNKTKKDIGTKRLGDFFIQVADCFIGDRTLGASSPQDLVDIAQSRGVETVMYLEVVPAQ